MGQKVNRAKDSVSRGHPGRRNRCVLEENMPHETEGGVVRMSGGPAWLGGRKAGRAGER